MRLRAAYTLLAGIAALGLSGPAAADILDWDTNPWTDPNSTSEVFTINGETVTVTISGTLNPPTSPLSNSTLTPGSDTRGDSLFLNTTNNAAPWVTLTFTFSHSVGVTDIDFSLFDVDSAPPGAFLDTVLLRGRIFGTTTYLAPSAVTDEGSPTWVWDNNFRIDGTASAASGADAGTANVTFSGAAFDGFQIQYQNNYAGPNGNQWISISDIAFRILPEPSPALLFVPALLLLARRRRA